MTRYILSEFRSFLHLSSTVFQVNVEATNREVREREVLTQLIRRKLEWKEEQIVRKGKDIIDRSHQHLWRVPKEVGVWHHDMVTVFAHVTVSALALHVIVSRPNVAAN